MVPLLCKLNLLSTPDHVCSFIHQFHVMTPVATRGVVGTISDCGVKSGMFRGVMELLHTL